MTNLYMPEGTRIDLPENQSALQSLGAVQEAMNQGRILEARALVCDSEHNLIVDLGCCKGLIPRLETVIGIDDGSARDIAIISRVNKPVCFFVTGFTKDEKDNPVALLSRRQVQLKCREDFVEQLIPGDILDARITHMESFGCFVDVGCGITSLLPIDAISISRISHPKDRFRSGQNIKVVVKSIDEEGRVTLSHKELLGTWDENANAFSAGETVAGIVRSVEPYGIFVELAPNLAGLAEPRDGVVPGLHASVYIKSLIPEKMKVKLIIVDAFEAAYVPPAPTYYIQGGRLDRWRYSPGCSERVIETVFSAPDGNAAREQ